MKHTLLFLFAALQTSFLFGQFDENYYGYYKSQDETTFCYLNKYSADEFGFELTEEEQKTCAFGFAMSNETEAAGSYAFKKGNVYVSVSNEYSTVYTFAFKTGSDGVRAVEITNESGKKAMLFQYTPDLEVDYYDDEYTDGGDYGYYDEEPTEEAVNTLGYSRSDGAELVVTLSEENVFFNIRIPATKSCPEVTIEGNFDSPNLENGAYTYTNAELGYKLEFVPNDSGWQIKCASGECFDKKGKCGIWKEAFMLNN